LNDLNLLAGVGGGSVEIEFRSGRSAARDCFLTEGGFEAIPEIGGSWPEGMRGFLVRVSNFYYRVWTYVTMVENEYPGFGLPAA
jgi:hypothetical protein